MYLADCILAAQNMFLKAYELGLGTCFMDLVPILKERLEVLKKVGVPEDYEMMMPLILGNPKTQRSTGKRKKPNIVDWTH